MSQVSPELLTAVTRIADLRSQFEAQLRSVARIEEHFNGRGLETDAGTEVVLGVLREEVENMLVNNGDIGDVLVDLASELGVVSNI